MDLRPLLTALILLSAAGGVIGLLLKYSPNFLRGAIRWAADEPALIPFETEWGDDFPDGPYPGPVIEASGLTHAQLEIDRRNRTQPMFVGTLRMKL